MDEKKTATVVPGSDTLGALWQSALGSIDEIRDVIVKGSQAGKAKLDVQMLKRQRDKLLAEIGAVVVAEHKRGATLPAGTEELADKVGALDAQIDEADAEAERIFKR